MFVELVPLRFPNKRKIFVHAHSIQITMLDQIVVLDSEAVEHVFPLDVWHVKVLSDYGAPDVN